MTLPPRTTPPTARPQPARPTGTKTYWRCIYGRSRPGARLRRFRSLAGSLVIAKRPAAARRGNA